MKKLSFILFLISASLIFTGCSDNKERTFSGGTDYSITVPKGWSQMDSLNKNADLCLGDSSDSKYLVIIKDYKEDFTDNYTIENYFELSRKGLLDAHDDSVLISSDIKNDCSYTASCIVDGVKVRFYASIKEDDKNFYQLIFWTTERQFESRLDEFHTISSSFTELI